MYESKQITWRADALVVPAGLECHDSNVQYLQLRMASDSWRQRAAYLSSLY
jgi:hypothetical protein